MKLPQFTLKEEVLSPPHLLWLGRHKQQSGTVSSAPFSSATDAILLIYSLTAKQTSQRYWGFFAEYYHTQKARKEELIHFQSLLFHKAFTFRSTVGGFFLPFEKLPSQFQLTLKHHLLSNFAKHLDVRFRMLRCFISVLFKKKATKKLTEKAGK